MPRIRQLSEKTQKVMALFPRDANLNVWYRLPNNFEGMLLENGSIDLRRPVKMTDTGDHKAFRIDRCTAKGNFRFIGYQPMTYTERQLY